MISIEAARERVKYAKRYGVEQTLSHFNLTIYTLKRYERMVRQYERQYNNPDHPAKILVLDIETSPLLIYAWGIFKPRPTHNDIYQDWHLLSWAAKWLLDDQMYSDVLTSEEAKAHNDARICKSVWEKVDEADIIIAHNLDRFDGPKLNARFLLNGLKPPSPYRSLDTLKAARGAFAHTSNRLDYLEKLLGGEGKLENPKGLWKDCFQGVPEALLQMEKYNCEDVYLLEDVYLFIRPWIKSHPNVGVYMFANESRCAICGGDSLHEESVHTTNAGMYRVFRCNDCGGLSRERRTMLPLPSRKVLLASMPR